MPNPAEARSLLRAWVLSLGSLAALLAGLLVAINLLPEPWPKLVAAALCLLLLIATACMLVGTYMDVPFGFSTWAERSLHAWTARFAPDPGAFLYRWAESSSTLDRARERLAMAAERGSAPAMLELGRDLLDGAMGTAARGAALPWLQRASDRGQAEAAYWMGEALRWGMAEPGRPEDAPRFYLIAARAGFRPAAAWLARAYAVGDGVAADPAQAAAWSERAERLPGSDAPGPNLLQRLADRPSRLQELAGEFHTASTQMGEILWPQRWFRTVTWSCTILFLALLLMIVLASPALLAGLVATALGLLLASLGMRLLGYGPQRARRGTRALEARALAGEPAACFELGKCYEGGHPDLPRDPSAAREWYQRAARTGHPEALLRLADLLSWGMGGPKDSAEARRLLERAAALGVPEAQARLGRLGFSAAPAAADEDGRGGGPP